MSGEIKYLAGDGGQPMTQEQAASSSEQFATIFAMIPQPPKGIKYLLGGETWLLPENRSPLRLCCEEWGNLGPLEMNPEIKPNAAGFRVRVTYIHAPEWATGFFEKGGLYYWHSNEDAGSEQKSVSN